MDKSLNAVLIRSLGIQNVGCPPCLYWRCLNIPPTTSLCSHAIFGPYKYLASIYECQGVCQWVPFIPKREIQWHTFLFTCLHSINFAPLLPYAMQQQNVTDYCQEGQTFTAISPTSYFDVRCQHNKIGSIIFGAALVHKIKINW